MSRAQFASIHPGLLARKGEATPALASALGHVAYVDGPAQPHQPRRTETCEQDDAVSAHYNVTLRINAEQRRRMWLASVQLGRSKQDILADALDVYLDHLASSDMKHCRCFCQNETPGLCNLRD